MGKDWGQLSKVPSKGESPISLSRKGSGGKGHSHPRGLKDEHSELKTAFIERPTPGRYKGGSAPGQSKSPSVRRTRRDDFELELSRDEKNRETDMGAGYAFPRGQSPPTVGSQQVRGEMRHRIIGET
jgi:hypothetical protein